jgi:ankyrin repeat protein
MNKITALIITLGIMMAQVVHAAPNELVESNDNAYEQIYAWNEAFNCLKDKDSNVEDFRKVVENGACGLHELIDENRKTLLHHAASLGRSEEVNLLLEKGTDPNVKDKNGNTALHIAARKGNLQAIQFLISEGAIIDAQNNNGDTALHMATLDGQAGSIQTLLKNNASPNIKNNDGYTPNDYQDDYIEFFKKLS